MTQRAQRNPVFEPMSTYEVHLGSWRPGLSYRQLARELTDYVVAQGFTHVELLPVAEHPFAGSWGYQVTSYYAPTSRFGTPDDFRALVDALHQAGIGVIVDWVPAHFPKDAWALGRFDGTPLYEHSDPKRGEQLDWGTYVFDFGRPEVRNFLVANALYWLEEFHIDGLRVDAVASMLYLDYSRPEGGWTPNIYGGRENLEAVQFLQEMNATAHKAAPGIVTIAEESTSWPGVTRPTNLGGLGFSMKWNMGWMHDTLDYISRDPIHRSYHHHEMTFSMLYAFSENFVLPISHDEVVHGKGTLWGRMPGNNHVKAAGLRSLLAYQWAHPGKQLLFMGQEFGQRAEWSEQHGLDWFQLDEHGFSNGILRFVRDINEIYRSHPALWSQDTTPEGYSWIDANDSANNVLSFLRYGKDGSVMACVFNFAGSEHSGYRLGLPWPAAGARCSTPTRRSTTAPGSATSAASMPPRIRGTAVRHRRCWCCRPRRRYGWNPSRRRALNPEQTQKHLKPRGFRVLLRLLALIQRVGEVATAGDDLGIGRIEEFEQLDQPGPHRGAFVSRCAAHQRDQALERRAHILVEDFAHRRRRMRPQCHPARRRRPRQRRGVAALRE